MHATFGQNVNGWRTSFRRTIFVVQTKILYCGPTVTHKLSFWRLKLSRLVRKFVSQNKAKNAGRSRKMRECGKYVKMRDFPHDCGMVDTYDIVYGPRV